MPTEHRHGGETVIAVSHACRSEASIREQSQMPGTRPPQSRATRPRSSGLPLPMHGSAGASGDFPVVGIGASAGGLDACRKLVGALPAGNGMAFILVQHLDTTHATM